MSDIPLRLNATEAGILRDLVEQMRALVKESDATDPVRARLFPNAYEDNGDSAAYRELTGGDLSAGKLEALDRVAETLGSGGSTKAQLTEEDAEAWVRTLTDMRLAIGTRLEVTEATMSLEPDPDDPTFAPLHTLHWLGWLQERILERMVP
ncbi:hypothetical protein BH20ACT23_BH20ACT23_13810 [soil metagenome]